MSGTKFPISSSSATNKKPDGTADSALQKMTVCDNSCEGLASDLCHRLVSESKQAYVKQEILKHLSYITVHQLTTNSTL